MSWLKKRGQTASPNPSAAPPVQMYNPNQHSNLQSQWQHQDLQAPSSNNWYPQTQPNQQTLQQPPYSQPVLQPNNWNRSYIQEPTNTYNPNPSNQYTEQYSSYNPLYSNENSSNQQTNYANQQSHNPPYNYTQTSEPQSNVNSDSWNWGWGDEDNSNVQNLPQANSTLNVNNVKSSNEETWNWTVEDSNTNSSDAHALDSHSSTSTHKNSAHQNTQHTASQSNIFPQMGKLAEKHSESTDLYSQDPNCESSLNQHSSAYSDNSSLNQAVISSTLKHNKIDHLTPQWSTESQMSQDSSDLLHTSESDKSHMLSRSSTISESPVSGHDINSENVIRQESPQNRHETSNVMTETSSSDSVSMNYYRQDTYSLHQENKEDISGLQEELKQYKGNSTVPPPPMKNQPAPHVSPLTDDIPKNPYKLNAGVSHKSASRHNLDLRQSGNHPINQSKYPVSQSPFNQSVNLETLPDNAEQPDTISHISKKAAVKPSVHHWPENNEVAPINDRNQYLETGQLSNNEFHQPHLSSLNDTSDLIPPPGFTRMVLGQMEQTDNVGNQDEPPPGLSRMVLGETCATSSLTKPDSAEPLHRMIPGGSSSPKPRYQPSSYPPLKFGNTPPPPESDLNAPVPNQIRSATIGADTPSVTTNAVTGASIANRSMTIGADITMPYSSSNLESIKPSSKVPSASSNFNNNIRETNLDGASNLDEKITPVVARRDSIEGETRDNSVTNLVNSIRDLNIGENLNNSTNSTLPVTERNTRRPSKQESTDSEQESVPRDRKERRYYEKHGDYDRERNRRYSPSPDRYREKKYERTRYRDPRYDNDTDYSDKDRDRKRDDKDRREELDRKYGSLKRDKEKRRKEQRNYRDYGRDGHRKDYYHRYEDEYDDHSRSRPSSRSDSLHDSYRQDRDRHRDKYRRNRDPYNMPYMQGYSYDPYNPYYQQYQYQYYENLRRTNPQAYAEWYRKYYQQSNSQQNYGSEDRASVHSGRSSANEELSKDRPFDQTDSTLYLEDTTVTSQRLTPAKFATAHVKASISSGRLVKIFPHYPLDGQPAVVEVNNLKELLVNDDEYKELVEFPGPLIKGVTHKKTIIEYCENKIRSAIYSHDIGDVDSYILMWELLILLLRQNGMVVGTDIAELLMKDKKQEYSRKGSIASNSSGVIETAHSEPNLHTDLTGSSASILKEEVVTNKFRELLIYGSEKEALEWSMKHGLWGHALFLASKLDKRTYANVMTRFANGLTMNDPLQTLYQLLSGKIPASVTCVSDEKWGDWRPHLAMILSNTTQRPELDRKAIMTLGDTLFARNSLYAAQFSYLMAQVEFSRYGTESAKLVLLGSNHNKPFMEFAINEAIFMTEVYEYACNLNDNNFVIPEFLPYKYLLATRLADRGLLDKSLAYLEKIAVAVTQNPGVAQPTLIRQVCVLGDRLKYCDLVEDSLEGDIECDNRPDTTWLRDLKTLENNFNIDSTPLGAVENSELMAGTDHNQIHQSAYEQAWPQQYAEEQYQQQQQWQPGQYDQQNNTVYQQSQTAGMEGYTSELYPDQHSYWTHNQLPETTDHGLNSNTQQQFPADLQSNSFWNSAPEQHEEVENQPNEVSKDKVDVFPSLQINGYLGHSYTNKSTFRKKLTSSTSSNFCKNDCLFNERHSTKKKESNESGSKGNIKKYKLYPFKNRSAEEFSVIKSYKLNCKSSSVDSSDYELECNSVRRRQKNVLCKDEEKSHLINYKDQGKVVSLNNVGKVTKYNTFDLKSNDKSAKIVKYKSLDEPISKTLIKYQDTQVQYRDARSNVSISTQDFDLSFKFAKFEQKPKRDIITNTVDSWAKKSTKNMLSNIKNSLFKGSSDKTISFKPLIFGGTFPIDAPTGIKTIQKKENVDAYSAQMIKSDSHKLLLNELPQVRKYGTPKTYDIDRPI